MLSLGLVIYLLELWSFVSEVTASPPLRSGPWGPRQPKSPDDRTVVEGPARFTVLSDRLIRMEYSETGTFEDRATMFAINRQGDGTNFTVTLTSQPPGVGVLQLDTPALRLSYILGEPFSASSLTVTSRDTSSAFESWHYGQANTGNLFGTIRTLDNERLPPLDCNLVASQLDDKCGWDYSDCACEWGVVSKEGWALVDDGSNYALSDESDFWDGPNADAVDCYLFGHGRDYKAAVRDFASVGGRMAMVPRAALGPWWTRWYDLSQGTAAAAVQDFADRGLPLDVFVIDM